MPPLHVPPAKCSALPKCQHDIASACAHLLIRHGHFAGLNPSFEVEWYSGRYDKVLLGIVPVGNLVEWVNRIHKDVAILEEPEHLNWYHSGLQWTEGFSHVVSS